MLHFNESSITPFENCKFFIILFILISFKLSFCSISKEKINSIEKNIFHFLTFLKKIFQNKKNRNSTETFKKLFYKFKYFIISYYFNSQ